MKKTQLLNSQLSYIISCLGHGDSIVIADAGLPIPKHVQRIDLAVSSGIPSFLAVLETVLCEMQVEQATMANPLSENNLVYPKILGLLQQGMAILPQLELCCHEEFKKKTETTICVVRTGEFTPYCNIILSSGVIF